MLREGLNCKTHYLTQQSKFRDLTSRVLWQSGVDRGEFLPWTTCFSVAM